MLGYLGIVLAGLLMGIVGAIVGICIVAAGKGVKFKTLLSGR